MNKKLRRFSEFSVMLDALVGGSQFGRSTSTGRDRSDDHLEDCRTMMLNDVAVVSVKIASPVYTRSGRSLRMTDADKIASFGNSK